MASGGQRQATPCQTTLAGNGFADQLQNWPAAQLELTKAEGLQRGRRLQGVLNVHFIFGRTSLAKDFLREASWCETAEKPCCY